MTLAIGGLAKSDSLANLKEELSLARDDHKTKHLRKEQQQVMLQSIRPSLE